MRALALGVSVALVTTLGGCTPVATEPATSPSATVSATPSAAPATTALVEQASDYEELCGLLGEARDLDAEVGPYTDAFLAYAAVTTDDTDPDLVAAAQDFGLAMLETGPQVIELYRAAAELVDDPVLVQAFEVSNRLNEEVSLPFAHSMAQAESMSEAMEHFDELALVLETEMPQDDALAVFELNAFSLETCGFTLRQR